MGRIKIEDLNIDLEEFKKKDPEILKKIRGGGGFWYSGVRQRVLTTRICYGGTRYCPE